ncbi:MAG: hypothetical protein NTU73_12350, partial [Ignavibacteriae bacterium]|nr:hypothetical protein [Ignavibacteriota bacterium]
MKKTILFILVLFIFGLDISYSQTDDNGAPYFPLRVGNAFYYKYYHCNPGGCDSAFVISRITQTKIFNGRRYYYVSNLFGRTNSNVYLRYNSSTGYLVYLDTTNAGCNYEMAIYNLSASIGDSVSSSCRYGVNFKCKSIVDSSIFGTILRVKKFGYYATSYGWITEAGTHFARQRGCLYDFSATYNNSFAAYQRFLQGCKINGVVYGDTIDHVTPPSYADSARYFPLLVGNSFYYKYYYYFNSILADSAFVVSRITGTISKNNKSYFVLTNFAGVANVNYYLRYDTTNGKLMKYDSTNSQCSYEKEFYNFIHIPRDSSVGNCAANLRQWCEKIKDTTFFNLQKKSKQYNWMTQSGNYGASKITYFIKDFGISSYHDGTSGIGHTTL